MLHHIAQPFGSETASMSVLPGVFTAFYACSPAASGTVANGYDLSKANQSFFSVMSVSNDSGLGGSTANRTAAGRGWSRHEAVKARIREPTNIQRYSRSPNITFLSQSHDYRSDRRVR